MIHPVLVICRPRSGGVTTLLGIKLLFAAYLAALPWRVPTILGWVWWAATVDLIFWKVTTLGVPLRGITPKATWVLFCPWEQPTTVFLVKSVLTFTTRALGRGG